jgi:hypothetical protein
VPTKTLAGIFACEDVISRSLAIHFLLGGYVEDFAFDGNVDRFRGITAVKLGELTGREGVILGKSASLHRLSQHTFGGAKSMAGGDMTEAAWQRSAV